MDLSQLYGPGFAGYLQGRESANNRNMQALQGMGMLSGMQTESLQRNAMQEQMLQRQRQAQQQVETQERIQGMLSQPDNVIQGMLGLPAAQARSLFALGGPGALSKVLEKNAEMPSELRLINALPEGPQRDAALRAKAGIAPSFYQSDLGGSQAGFTRDPVSGEIAPAFQVAKTPAPGAIPFEMGGLTPEQARDFSMARSRAGASRTTNINNVNAKPDNAYFTERRKNQAQQFQDLEKAAESATKQVTALDRFIEANRTGTAGGAQPVITGVQNLLSSMGYESKTLTNVRVMEQVIGDILQNKMSELGARGLTDKDMQILRDALPRVATDRKSREDVANIVKKSAESTIENYKAARTEEARIYPEFSQNTPSPLWLRSYDERRAGVPGTTRSSTGGSGRVIVDY